jgi:hypothetical protein
LTEPQHTVEPPVPPYSPFPQPPALPPAAPLATVPRLPRRSAAKRTIASRRPRALPEALPYRRAPFLLSKGERAFWRPLYRAVKGKYRIFCKVRLADIASCPRENRNEWLWFRMIGRYHVDFVICEPRTTAPLLVIELDDRLHRERPRQDRDDFKDAVLRAAGVPVYRVNAAAAYDPIELAQNIERLINGQKS